MGNLSPHFDAAEFGCSCGCGLGTHPGDVDQRLLDLLEGIRTLVGRPLTVNSGLRCIARNRQEGGVVNSAHLRGTAADLSAHGGRERFDLVVAAVVAAIEQAHNIPGMDWPAVYREVRDALSGIGVGQTFVHLDTDRDLPRPSAWGYGEQH